VEDVWSESVGVEDERKRRGKKVDELWRAVLLCGILRLGEGERRVCYRFQE
jgi:hypothetical protein